MKMPLHQEIIGLFLIMLTVPFTIAATTTSDGNTTFMTQGSLSLSLINQDPDPVSAGDVVELRIGVENMGGTAINDLTLELLPSYPFLALPGESLIQNIGTLTGYQYDANMRIVKLKVRVDPQATAGDYTMKILEYTSGIRETNVESDIPVSVASQDTVQVIFIDKTVLVPGQETPVTFTINNVGKAPLNNLQFTWSNSENIILPVSGTAARYVEKLDVGASVKLTYQVIASTNADANLYPIDLTLTYDDPSGSGDNSFTTIAGVYVGGGTDFSVSYDSSTGGEYSFNIANIGSNAASAVAVSIPKQDNWRVSGARTALIGSLAKGDYTIASFILSGQGKQPVTVEIAYTDTMGNRNAKQYSVDLNTETVGNFTGFGTMPTGSPGRQATQNSSSSAVWIIISIIAIVAASAAIFWYARKRKKK